MNSQELYDRTKTHLLAQGGPAISPMLKCRYRGPDDTKCAVGFWIKDEFYNKSLEGGNTTARPIMIALLKSHPDFTDDNFRLLNDLQHVHDSAAKSESPWEPEVLRRLTSVARDWRLVP